MKTLQLVAGALLVCLAIAGCDTSGGDTPSAANIDGSKYLSASEPEGGQDVLKVRETAMNDDDVVVIGRIGGSHAPWTEGRAAFSIVDRSIKACSDIDDDHCVTPWDYCCEPKELLAPATVLVKVVDEQGELVKAGAKELLKLKELDTVVVQGKAQRDMDGNLTAILASSIYVKK